MVEEARFVLLRAASAALWLTPLASIAAGLRYFLFVCLFVFRFLLSIVALSQMFLLSRPDTGAEGFLNI